MRSPQARASSPRGQRCTSSVLLSFLLSAATLATAAVVAAVWRALQR
jgi:hypothetical protein